VNRRFLLNFEILLVCTHGQITSNLTNSQPRTNSKRDHPDQAIDAGGKQVSLFLLKISDDDDDDDDDDDVCCIMARARSVKQ